VFWNLTGSYPTENTSNLSEICYATDCSWMVDKTNGDVGGLGGQCRGGRCIFSVTEDRDETSRDAMDDFANRIPRTVIDSRGIVDEKEEIVVFYTAWGGGIMADGRVDFRGFEFGKVDGDVKCVE